MKIVLELDRNLKDGELLIYENNKVKSVDIHKLLPAYLKSLDDIAILQKRVCELEMKVKELRGEDNEESN